VFQSYPTVTDGASLHSGRPVFNQELLKTLTERHARRPLRITEDGLEVL
jgi:hypothetical protein